MPCLVKFGVVGDIALGNKTQQPALAAHCGAVIEPVEVGDGKSDNEKYIKLGCGVKYGFERSSSAVFQCFGEEKVSAGVACDAKLGENQHRTAVFGSFTNLFDYLFGIEGAVCHLDIGHSTAASYKSVVHNILSFLSEKYIYKMTLFIIITYRG